MNVIDRAVLRISLSEAKTGAIKKLGQFLDGVYSKNAPLEIAGVSLTPSECSELYSVYSEFKAGSKSVETISQAVHDVLDALGFSVKTKGIGWVVESANLTEAYRYSFKDVPEWAKPIVKDHFTEFQGYSDLYDAGDFVELSYREGGDPLTFRVYRDGTIAER